MKISDIFTTVNLGVDEDYDNSTLLEFANDCIGEINIECNSCFPFLAFATEEGKVTLEDEYPLPQKWIQTLFMPYLSARIKQMDSSQFEYNDYFEMFYQKLRLFKERYNIPDEFLDGEDTTKPTVHQMDMSGFFGMGGW